MRPHEAAVLLQGSEVERQVTHRRGEDSAGGAAGQIRLEAMALQHPAAIFLDQLARGDAGGRQHDARFPDAAGDREAAQPLALAPAMRGEPPRALLHDVAHPVERLDVLLEGGAAEQADLCDVRRAVPGEPALALDRFDHRGFFAADISTGAAAQMNARIFGEPGRFDLGDLLGEHQPHVRIFVADVDVDFRRFDHPGRDQHALDEAMRIPLEIVAVLEGTRLALVGIDRE